MRVLFAQFTTSYFFGLVVVLFGWGFDEYYVASVLCVCNVFVIICYIVRP